MEALVFIVGVGIGLVIGLFIGWLSTVPYARRDV
jgi:hypothetical protein